MWNRKLDCKFSMTGNRKVGSIITDAKVTIHLDSLAESILDDFDPSLASALRYLSDTNIKAIEYDVSRLKRIALELDGQKLYCGKFNKLLISGNKNRKYTLKITFSGNEEFNASDINPFPRVKLRCY